MSLRRLAFFLALLFTPHAFAATPPVYALPALGDDLNGIWEGSFEGSGMGLDIAFTVKSAGDKSVVTVDLLDDTHGIPASAATRTGLTVRFELKDIAGSFEGALTSDGEALQGTWIQAGRRIPLSLRKRVR